MNIWIDSQPWISYNGGVLGYCPKVHWELSDKDVLTPQKMRDVANKIQKVLDKDLMTNL